MLPVIPVVVAAASAAVLIRRKFKKNSEKKNLQRLIHYVSDNNISINEEGHFNPDVLLKDGTPLLFSVMHDHELFSSLLDCGANPNICNADGMPAIIQVLSFEKSELLVSQLLKHGANPNAMDTNGTSVLFYAVKANNSKIISLLINNGACIDALDSYGRTCLFYASAADCIALIMSKGGRSIINAKDYSGKTALFYASNTTVIQMLSLNNINPNIRDNLGQTALFTAKSSDLVNTLLEIKLNPNIQDNEGKTALFYIPKNRALLSLCLLTENILDVNIQDNDGHTALYYQKDEYIIYKIASHKNCNVNITNFEGRHPLSYVTHPKKFKQMIEWGADVNYRDAKGRHILFFIDDKQLYNNSNYIQKALINILADTDCDPKIRDFDNNPAPAASFLFLALEKHRQLNAANSLRSKNVTISSAVAKHHYEDVAALLEQGDNPNEMVKKQTLLTQAISQNDEKLVQILIEYGADLTIPNSYGITPLVLAVQQYNPECCEVLLKAGAKIDSDCFKLARDLGNPDIIQLFWKYAPKYKGNYNEYKTCEMRKKYLAYLNEELGLLYSGKTVSKFNIKQEFNALYNDCYSREDLLKAIDLHDTEAVKYMIDKNIKDGRIHSFLSEFSFIRIAVSVNAPDIILLLCQNGILNTYQESPYNNPVVDAVNQKREKCTEVLLRFFNPCADICITYHPGIMKLIKNSLFRPERM